MFANSAVLSRLSALEAALDADLELERRRAAESAATALADEEAARDGGAPTRPHSTAATMDLAATALKVRSRAQRR